MERKRGRREKETMRLARQLYLLRTANLQQCDRIGKSREGGKRRGGGGREGRDEHYREREEGEDERGKKGRVLGIGVISKPFKSGGGLRGSRTIIPKKK